MANTLAMHFHHVGYAVKHIEEISAIYVSRFGYQVATPIIHDPLQTAFVQFLQLPNEQSYLEFVAPDGPESKLTHAAKRGGLNHLCYSVGPLEQIIPQLEDNGMRLISEPKTAAAFAGRRICWLIGEDPLPIELVERRDDTDACKPGEAE
jgi:catechol 2,3-dioxygenase-like lactoylglutathione lyase family enzyme